MIFFFFFNAVNMNYCQLPSHETTPKFTLCVLFNSKLLKIFSNLSLSKFVSKFNSVFKDAGGRTLFLFIRYMTARGHFNIYF
jgi:hypothetical protein